MKLISYPAPCRGSSGWGDLLAIDPGAHTGWACFDSMTKGVPLRACGVGCPSLSKVLKVVIELPRVYPTSRVGKPVPPNDLVDLAFLAGRYCGLAEGWAQPCGAQIFTVLPAEWKGQLPKEVSHRRILMQLSFEERKVVEECERNVSKGVLHNALDAIGIGLYAFRSCHTGG